MPSVFFVSREDAEVIDVEFVRLDGRTRQLRLLVDSGFTGKSSFVLSHDAVDLARAELPPTRASGALQGPQDRTWVTCRIPGLQFQRTLVAIIADVSALSLPSDVEGMAGLGFLREFSRWGALRTEAVWRFYLSDGDD